MTVVTIAVIPEQELGEYIYGMDKATREWTMQAARGECGWVCSDCCCTFNAGMPDECCYGDERCTAIIKRDKHMAMISGNEPS